MTENIVLLCKITEQMIGKNKTMRDDRKILNRKIGSV